MKLVVVLALLSMSAAALAQDGKTVYRCPGATPADAPLYTDALSAKEAQAKNCRTLEGAPITVIQGPKPRTTGATTPSATGPLPTVKVDPNEQRARDSDARRILESELAKAQGELAALQAEYKGGEPDRLGNERNYQKYLDRTAELKAGIERKESDIAAIKREIAKLPS